jgi:hypothetical protein
LVQLPPNAGGRSTTAHGAVAPTGGDGGSGETEEEENPGGPVLGRKAVVTWAGVGFSKENQDGLPWRHWAELME